MAFGFTLWMSGVCASCADGERVWLAREIGWMLVQSGVLVARDVLCARAITRKMYTG